MSRDLQWIPLRTGPLRLLAAIATLAAALPPARPIGLAFALCAGPVHDAVAATQNSPLIADISGSVQGHIDGGSRRAGEEGNIELQAYTHSILRPHDPSTGLPSGAVQHNPFVITKEQDRSTVPLLAAMVSGERLSVTIRLYKDEMLGAGDQKYYTVTLTSATIVSHAQVTGDMATEPTTETFGFTYDRILWKDEITGEVTTDNWVASSTSLDQGSDATWLRSVPNPTVSDTVFRFDLPVSSSAELVVYDTRGRVVRRLFDGFTPIDRMAVSWDGTDDSGARVAKGMYLVKLRYPEGEVTQRVTMLR